MKSGENPADLSSFTLRGNKKENECSAVQCGEEEERDVKGRIIGKERKERE